MRMKALANSAHQNAPGEANVRVFGASTASEVHDPPRKRFGPAQRIETTMRSCA
jgi:hypothetical protein